MVEIYNPEKHWGLGRPNWFDNDTARPSNFSNGRSDIRSELLPVRLQVWRTPTLDVHERGLEILLINVIMYLKCGRWMRPIPDGLMRRHSSLLRFSVHWIVWKLHVNVCKWFRVQEQRVGNEVCVRMIGRGRSCIYSNTPSHVVDAGDVRCHCLWKSKNVAKRYDAW